MCIHFSLTCLNMYIYSVYISLVRACILPLIFRVHKNELTMTWKCHNHRLQTNPTQRETIKSNQPIIVLQNKYPLTNNSAQKKITHASNMSHGGSSQRQQSGTSPIWGLTHHRTNKEKITALNCDCVYN